MLLFPGDSFSTVDTCCVSLRRLLGCARCQHWQWHVHGWFYWCFCTSRCMSFPLVVRPMMLCIMAGFNQRDSYVAWCLWFRLLTTVDFPQLQFIVGRRFSCRGAEADSHGPCDH